MSFESERDGDHRVMGGELTIYAASQMKSELLSLLDAHGAHFSLDLSQVVEIDTCGLQVLLMLRRSAAEQGRDFRVIAASAAIREVFELCGLSELLPTAVEKAA